MLRRLASYLEAGGLLVAAAAGSVAGLVEAVTVLDVAVVVLGWDMSATERIAGIRRIRAAAPHAGVVVVAVGDELVRGNQLVNAGVDGVIRESEAATDLALAVRAVASGNLIVPRNLRRCVARPALSLREKQILAMVAKGFRNSQIASHLFLAESTVKSHLSACFEKLGVNSRTEAAALVTDRDEGLYDQILGVELEDPPVAWSMVRR